MKNKKEAVKKNLSSTQVLKTLRVLMEDDYSMVDLIEKLNEKEHEPIFNNSVVSKYINTCRFCGITIPKIQNKYYVSKLPFGMDVSDEEYAVLQDMQDCADIYISKKSKKQFDKFIHKVNVYSNRDIIRVEENSVNLLCAAFEKALETERKIKLLFKTGKSITGIPLRLSEYKGKRCITILYNNNERLIMFDRITGIEITKEKFKQVKLDGTVLFKLTGALAANYNLRENETLVINNKPDYITVMNDGENNLALINRLLRYGELCEIESPKHIRDAVKRNIDDALANYGVI